jgi:hypothetical protein
MKARLIFSSMIVVFCVRAAKSHAQDCYEDTGNICLSQCGVYRDNGDLAAPYPNGAYTATAIYPDCTATCDGHAIGISYFEGYPCYDYDKPMNISRVQYLLQIAPGAPIFVPSCSGNLVQANVSPGHVMSRSRARNDDFTTRLRDELTKEVIKP